MQLFISHSSHDKPTVKSILGHLDARWRRWIDEYELNVGDVIPAKLSEAIQNNSSFLVVFLSEEAMRSPWVVQELEAALVREDELGRTFILPVLLDLVSEETWEQPPFAPYKNSRRIECFQRTDAALKAAGESLDSELVGLLMQINEQRDTGWPRSQPPISVEGEWESVYTWEPENDDDSGCSRDRLVVKQTGDKIEGETGTGFFRYELEGSVRFGCIEGRWRSKSQGLFGVFQLLIGDVDYENHPSRKGGSGGSATGFWIGNGPNRLFQGEWHWTRAGVDRRGHGRE